MEKQYTKRVELNCHSNYSELNCVASVKNILDFALKDQMPAVALTDFGNVIGYGEASVISENYPQIKMIYGIEAYVLFDTFPKAYDILECQVYTVTILIKNNEGKRELFKLVSDSELQRKYDTPVILWSELEKYRKNLLIGSGNEDGVIYKIIKDGSDKSLLYDLMSYFDYIEVQPEASNIENVQEVNKIIIEESQKVCKTVVAVGNVFYVTQDENIALDVLKEIPQGMFQINMQFRTTQEMLDEFSYIDEDKAWEIVVTNTNIIAEQTEEIDVLSNGENLIPICDKADEKLEKICNQRLAEIYGDNINGEIIERLKWELNGFSKSKMATIMLLARQLIVETELSPYEIGYRGLVGASLVAYLCGITCVNPIEVEPHLIPEFFMGIDGDMPIDIDLNFTNEGREKVWENCYNHDEIVSVVHAGNYKCISERTANKLVDSYEADNDMRFDCLKRNKIVEILTHVVSECGYLHPGGMLLIPKEYDVYNFTPIMKSKAGKYVISEISWHFLENLYRLDILKSPSTEFVCKLVEMTGYKVEDIPLDDINVYKLFQGRYEFNESIDSWLDASGVPSFDSDYMNKIAATIMPDCFADLVKIFALKYGTSCWEENAEILINSGFATKEEIIACREDIFDYMIAHGFKRNEAWDITNFVIKGNAIGGKADNIEWSDIVKRLEEHNVPDWYIWSCEHNKYLFSRAQAYRYALDDYWCAWFKINYPQEFYNVYFEMCDMKTLVNVVKLGFESLQIYKEGYKEAKIKEIELLGEPIVTDMFEIYVAEEMFMRGYKLNG